MRCASAVVASARSLRNRPRPVSPVVRASIVLGLLVAFLAPVAPLREAWAGEPRFADQHGPAISGSMAVALRPGGATFHMWLGAGVRVPATRFRAVLLGVELDAPLNEDAAGQVDSQAAMMSSSPGPDLWLVSRVVTGAYAGVGWAPMHSAYAFAGVPLRVGPDSAHIRVGVGASAIELLPLAEIGIPNMIELGMDVGDQAIDGFLRLGWHF